MCAFLSDAWTGSALLFHTSPEYSSLCPRTSAISISRDWVLTHGNALYSIIRTSEAISKFVANMAPGQLTSMPEELAKKMEFSVLRERNTGIEKHVGKVAFAWICPLVTRTLKKFFSTWNFYEYDMAKSHQQRLLFLLIRVDCDRAFAKIPSAEQALRCLQDQVFPQSVSRGTPVEIVSAPFGNVSLINSITQGIVSNVIGGIIITDAYVLPKSEGGPLYIVSPDSGSRTLIGMIIVTMSWCQNEWVNYTLTADLASCLSTILQQTPIPSNELVIRHDRLNALDRSIVIITCGSSKGTGILVDKDTGTFFTCSHVVEKAPEMEISVVTLRDLGDNLYSRVPAKLLFKNSKTLAYDVAVLKVEPSELDPSLEPIQFSDASIVQGEPVIAVGFPFFLSTPTMSSGVVAKSLDCMLTTTCCIHSGFSGGPIISRTTGRMLGMIVSNAVSVDKSVNYRRMSMSVPVTVLSKPLRQYLLADNVDALRPLVSYDSTVWKIWALDSGLPSKL